MKLIFPDNSHLPERPRQTEQGRAGIIILALISFLLGVTATTFWFRLNPPGVVPAMNPQTSSPSEQQPAEKPPSRAIAPTPAFVEKPVPVAPDALEEVKKLIPNYASVSLADAEQTLRNAGLKEFAAAANELQDQVTKAEQELKEAEAKSPADQQAAMKHLQQVEVEQGQKLREISGRLATQIAALKQLKGAAQ